MSRKRWLFIVSLFILPVSLLSQPHGLGSTSFLQTPPAHPQGSRVVNREAPLLNKLKSLLEPLGIAVDKSSLLDVDKVNVTRDLTISWEAYPEATQPELPAEKTKDRPPGKGMQLIKSQRRQNSLERRYGFDLTEEHLFIAAVNNKSQLKWWTVIYDPRIIRGHSVGPNGELAGRLYYRSRPEILISPPDSAQISEIRILQPKWTGAEFVLELLALVPFSN